MKDGRYTRQGRGRIRQEWGIVRKKESRRRRKTRKKTDILDWAEEEF